MVTLSLALLGPFLAQLDDQPLTRFRSKTVQALLIYLASQPEVAHRREHLMALLWPDLPQKSAQANLRQNLYRLRRAIPELPSRDGRDVVVSLLADQQTVQINPASRYELDVLTFGQLLKKGQERWPEAVALYRGDFLSDFYLPDSAEFEAWVLAWRADLRRQVLEMLDELTNQAMARGDYPTGEGYARQQLTIDNLRENAHRQLMENLALNGRRTEALSHYDDLKQLLQQELGVEPSAGVLALQARIMAGEMTGTETSVKVTSNDPLSGENVIPEKVTEALPLTDNLGATTESEPLHNLPVQATPFIGRETELAQLDDLMAESNGGLITIAGPGGIGKTRLAIALAERQLRANTGDKARFPDGVYFVALASLSQAEHIVPALADALGFEVREGSQRTPWQQLLHHLGPKRLLLIMDNFEHLLDGSHLLTDALQAAPTLQIVATSRERLHLHSEQLYPLQGLERPLGDGQAAAETAASKLFLQAARRIRPNFDLRDSQDLAHLINIFQQTDGSPLALELAASWVDVLSLEDIAAEIQQSLDFLETTMQGIPPRHRSMRAIFETSWQKLTANERLIIARLSVFRGGFTREAAQAVSSPSLRDLAQLVIKSLLQYERASKRYQIHELLRQFGAEKLAEDEAEASVVHDHHCAYYCVFLQQQGETLKGSNPRAAAAAIRTELDNCRLAWDWAINRGYLSHLTQGLDGLAHYMLYWAFRGEEATLLLKRVAEQVTGSESVGGLQLLIRVLSWQSTFSDFLGERELSDQQCQKGMTLLNHPLIRHLEHWPARAFVLYQLAKMIHFSDRGKGQQLMEQSRALSEATGDHWGEARALKFLAVLAHTLGNSAAAEQLIKESFVIHQASGNQAGKADSLYFLGACLQSRNRLVEAESLLVEGLAISRDTNNQNAIVQTLLYIGLNHELLGRPAQALAAYNESLHLLGQRGYSYFVAFAWIYSSLAHLHLGQYEKAKSLGEQALHLGQKIGKEAPMTMALRTIGRVALAQGDFPTAHEVLQESAQRIRAYGRTGMPPELAVGLGVSSLALLGLGRSDEAIMHLHEALMISQRTGYVRATLMNLAAASMLFIEQGKVKQGIELYALAKSHLHVANSRWFEDVCGQHIAAAAATLPPDVAKSRRRRGLSLDWQETLSELAQELNQM